MTEFDATVRKIGDSMGIIIPHKVIRQLRARPGQTVHIVIPSKVDWTRIWGQLHAEESTAELIRRSRTDRD
ncbi:MAG: hypothetical protein L3K00_03975 [Thermoplasmata archaeon]|nr:hypothetical protein [Thermoplasmata archaeon]MCI4362425.1 hypothetical protein [Thermoplasmata archaeon]